MDSAPEGSAGTLLDRSPPFDLDAEFSVLGSVLQDPNLFPDVLQLLTAGMFYREAHRRLFRAMARLWESAETVDYVTLADQLRKTGELEAVGGLNYISTLLDVLPIKSQVEHHARLVREKAQLRRLLDACSTSIRDVYDVGDRTVAEVIGEAERRVMAVSETVVGGERGMKELLWRALVTIEERQANPNRPTGIPTGLHDLDSMTLGLHPGQLTVVAARPSMGKSSLALQFALHAAANTPVDFYSLEMGGDELTERALAAEARIDLQALRSGRPLNGEENTRLANAAGALNLSQLTVDDADDPHLHSLLARARRGKQKRGTGMVIVDYLQLMEGVGDNRREKVDSCTRGMKRLARSLHIPVVLLSQLSRGPESRTDKRPIMSDLRESGGIEQDADNVIMLYRPEYYMNPQQLREAGGGTGLTELLIPKQRNGPTGSVKVYFRKASTRFESAVRDFAP